MNEQDKKILHVKRLLSSVSAGIRTLNEGQHFKNAESLCKLMRLMAVTSRLLVFLEGSWSSKKYIIPGHHDCNMQLGDEFDARIGIKAVEAIEK